MSCGIGHRCGSDPVLLWLWRRPAATAPIRLLAWEPPYAMGAALEKTKTKKQENSVDEPPLQVFSRLHYDRGNLFYLFNFFLIFAFF